MTVKARGIGLLALLLVLLVAACAVSPQPATPTPTLPPPATPTATPTSGPCQLTALGEVTAYQRPSHAAAVFGTLAAGEQVRVVGRTADGWLGFTPDVAQAANIGVFRLRWIERGANVRLAGGCDAVPVVPWAPPPDGCFLMPMAETPVYAAPATTAAVLATLKVGEFAVVTGQTADRQWVRVDLGVGNTRLSGVGWVEQKHWNFNGPCDNLPVVSP
jgi:hypothetical protein